MRHGRSYTHNMITIAIPFHFAINKRCLINILPLMFKYALDVFDHTGYRLKKYITQKLQKK